MTLADWITSIEWYGATLLSIIFVVLYWWGSTRPGRTPWWRSWEGRVIMGLHSVIIGFAILGVLYRILGDNYVGQDVLRVLFFGFWFLVMLGFVILLIRAQRHGKRTLSERTES